MRVDVLGVVRHERVGVLDVHDSDELYREQKKKALQCQRWPFARIAQGARLTQWLT